MAGADPGASPVKDCAFWRNTQVTNLVLISNATAAVLVGTDQALDACMDERRDLFAAIDGYRALLANEQQANANLQDEYIAQENILVEASLYVGRAKELLAGIGITVETLDNGYPALSVDRDQLLNAFA